MPASLFHYYISSNIKKCFFHTSTHIILHATVHQRIADIIVRQNAGYKCRGARLVAEYNAWPPFGFVVLRHLYNFHCAEDDTVNKVWILDLTRIILIKHKTSSSYRVFAPSQASRISAIRAALFCADTALWPFLLFPREPVRRESVQDSLARSHPLTWPARQRMHCPSPFCLQHHHPHLQLASPHSSEYTAHITHLQNNTQTFTLDNGAKNMLSILLINCFVGKERYAQFSSFSECLSKEHWNYHQVDCQPHPAPCGTVSVACTLLLTQYKQSHNQHKLLMILLKYERNC